MAIDKATQAALAHGSSQAKKVLELRSLALNKREKALKAQEWKNKMKIDAVMTMAPVPKLAGEGSAGMLVAEGDSWFDYPFHDVLKLLEDEHGYDVESVAHKGDPIESMAYGEHQLNDFTRCIEKVIRRGVLPKAILLSGGGNDIAGDEFGMLVNHAHSSIAGLNMNIVEGVIHERIRTAYVTILSAATEVCKQLTGAPTPIFVHGYDYPVPDGRGFMGGWGPLPGPWLEPGFRMKGFEDIGKRVEMARILIDHFNTMLAGIVTLPEFAHVKHIDLRNTLSHDVGHKKTYKKDWANELHPNGDGFGKVTGRFAKELEKLM